MLVALDNGHGVETPGKRSPDGLFREYRWTRDFVRSLSLSLNKIDIPTFIVTPEEEDIPISERAKRINKVNPTFCISVHNNAHLNKWTSANGWSVHLDNTSSVKSKELARIFVKEMEEGGLNVRKFSHHDPYWTQSLGICRLTKCSAILTENLFMTNISDVQKLNDPKFVDELIVLYIRAILTCLETF